jgi:hypothetical protein
MNVFGHSHFKQGKEGFFESLLSPMFFYEPPTAQPERHCSKLQRLAPKGLQATCGNVRDADPKVYGQWFSDLS